jgi:hypothetical protein
MSADTKVDAKRSPVPSATKEGFVGDIVAWEFADDDGFSVPRDVVRAIFERHGFNDCVGDDRSDPANALTRALRAGGTKKGRGIVVEPMERKNKDTPAAVAIYVKATNEGETGDDWQGGARVRIDPTTNLAIALPLEGQPNPNPRCFAIAEALAKKANELMDRVTNQELSAALTAAGKQTLWAAYRRKCGGVYFIFSSHAPRYRALLDDLEKCSGFWATVQPLFGDSDGRTMRNVTAATEYALEKELSDLREDMEKLKADGMRQHALDARVVKCQELIVRASLYRTVLAERSDLITKEVEQLRKQFRGELVIDDSIFDEIDAQLALDAPAPTAAPIKVEMKAAPAPAPKVVAVDDLFTV